jgi:excinuclease ABC subunit A
MGPGAGIYGGEVIFGGSWEEFLHEKGNLTSDYITGRRFIEVPKRRRKFSNKLLIKGAAQHNLKGFDVTIPLQAMTVISGVSGSGKSTLVKNILYPAIRRELGQAYAESPGALQALEGDVEAISQVEFVSQNPIGRSSRSNPVTYIKAYDAIRKRMVQQQLSKIRGYKPKHFSFNVDGGRCETCKGDGAITIEMQFLADIQLICEDCKGKRFKDEILEVTYKDKNIYEILELSISEAIQFFKDESDIAVAMQPLEDVGLGYIKLGQPSSTLSGGEAQRLKLAYYLARENSGEHMLFIFDEPTTGLHFQDINKLLYSLNALIERGHSVLIIEHNMDVIKCADWLIDLGPGGGIHGGELMFQGRPEDIIKVESSHTARYLREKLGT